MTDVTVTTQAPPPTPPQAQPGPARTPDGTIVDQSILSTTSQTPPPSTSTPQDSSTTPPPAAPERYEFKSPEGATLDPKAIEAAIPIFKELNLPQDAAQKLVDFYAAQTKSAAEAPYKAFAEMTSKWKDEVATTYGKDIEPGGKHFISVGRLLSQLGPAESAFREAMNNTGAGSHPAFVAAFIKLADMLGEGSHVAGNQPSPLGQTPGGTKPAPSLAAAMYPHLPSAG